MNEKQVAWTLSEIFPSTSHPSLEKAFTEVAILADKLEAEYRDKIIKFKAYELKKCLLDIEKIQEKVQDLTLFANLAFSADMTLQENQKIFDRINKLEANLSKKLAFVSLEMGKLVKNKPEIISDPILQKYEHTLERILRRTNYQLSEVEEQLIIEKDQFGVNAWEELHSKWLNTRLFEITVKGEKMELPYGEINGLLVHPDRKIRKAASVSIYGKLSKDGEIFASALRNICNDWVTVSKRRGYSTPMESSIISNDTEPQIVDQLLKTINNNVEVYRRYLKIKATLMNLPKLANYDVLAPLQDRHSPVKFSFDEAKELVIKAYQKFDQECANAIEDIFKKSHLDASPRFGKRNGAFCAGWYRGNTSFILQSFTGSLTDVYTLAHELGHATHNYFAQKNQTILNLNIPSIVAETASIFSELLLTDLLLEKANSDSQKKAALCLLLDEGGIATFQVTARVWFEQSLYESIEKGEFLDYNSISKQWITSRNRVYGESVEWLPEMNSEWTIKPHYYMANYRFYNYPYVYGQMFVYALYQKYKQEGKAFIPKFKQALSAGNSKSPKKIASLMGLNVTTENFWKKGINQYQQFIDKLENISNK